MAGSDGERTGEGERSDDEFDVLVVDDEARLADLFAAWISTERSVETAYDGDDALSKMSDSVEVVLLDRRMPGLSGDDVLESMREAGYDCRVVMVTAVDPDFDIVEMGFDDYLVKPVSKDELLETIEAVSDRSSYEAAIQEYFALVSKKSLLEAEKAEHELENDERYIELLDRIETLGSDVDDSISELSAHEDFVEAFQDLQSED